MKREANDYRISQLESLIKLKSNTTKFYIYWTLLQFVLSVLSVFFGIIAGGEYLGTALKIGGGISVVLSGFPIKEIFNNKGAITIFRNMIVQFRNYNHLPKYDQEKIVELFWNVIKKYSEG